MNSGNIYIRNDKISCITYFLCYPLSENNKPIQFTFVRKYILNIIHLNKLYFSVVKYIPASFLKTTLLGYLKIKTIQIDLF